MRTQRIICFSVIAIVVAPLIQCSCSRFFVRKEYRDMSSGEWDVFKQAILSLQNMPNNSSIDGTEWDGWTKMHIDQMMNAHNNPAFFPWHRAFILSFEKRLQQFNENVTIPYWDWTYDYKKPLDSPIFSKEYGLDVELGGDCRYKRKYIQDHCLLREYDPNNFGSWYSPSAVASVIKNENDYESFRQLIELVPHAIVHNQIGGKKGDFSGMNSPNDPLFFFHHSMIDYIWWIWQRRIENGTQLYSSDLEHVLDPFGIKVIDVLNLDRFCTTFQPFSRNNDFNNPNLGGVNDFTIRSMLKQKCVMASLAPKQLTLSKEWLEMTHLDKDEIKKVVQKFNKIAGAKGQTEIVVI